MAEDQYSATWVSHSSISDFLKCPRLYFLRNVYKDPISRNKINIIEPSLALGQAVHEVIESLSSLPLEERFSSSPLKKYELVWQEISGEKGGFKTKEQEGEFFERGRAMLQRVINNPGPISRKAVKIKSPDNLPPRYLISEEDNIILCGKIDWLEYLPKSDSVHIIDFKTGKWEQDGNSLQLPIYFLLANNLQKRNIKKASYWYLEMADKPSKVQLPDLKTAHERVLNIAERIKLARQIEHFKCPKEGCQYCLPYEQIVKGKGEKVNVNEYQDIYVL
jgi:ATP-dependent helicase/DNAse subunit B